MPFSLLGGLTSPGWEHDAWQWIDGNWTKLALPPGFPGVVDQTNAQLVYDAADGYVVLVAAYPTFVTWTYSGGLWRNVTPGLSPPANEVPRMVYDAADSTVLLVAYPAPYESFGGSVWSYRAGNWTNWTGPGMPGVRYGESLVYDSTDGVTLLTGGSPLQNQSTGLNDTWEFQGGNWTPLPASPFPPRTFATWIDDPVDHGTVFFGGLLNSSWAPTDTWVFSAGNWTQLNPALAPSARDQSGGAYDSTAQEALLYSGSCESTYLGVGGCSPPNSAQGDAWTFHAGNWSETPLAVVPPSPVRMVYDAGDGYLLGVSQCSFLGTYVTMTWSFAQGIWSPVQGAGCPFNTDSELPSITYDALDGYVVAVSGNTTWAYQYGYWTEIASPSSGSFPSVDGSTAGLTYDAEDRCVLLFGGSSSGSLADAAETWEFHGGTWTNVSSVGVAHPPARFDPDLVYDPGARDVVLFGGADLPDGSLNDTWTFSAGHWTAVHSTESPPSRYGAGMTYDEAEGHLVLFGGEYHPPLFRSSPPPGPRGDLWEFASGTWTNLTPALSGSPPPATAASMVYDVADGYSVMIAVGSGYIYPLENDGSVTSTWIWNGSLFRTAAPQVSSLDLSSQRTDVGAPVQIVATGVGGVAPLSWQYFGLPPGCATQNSSSLTCDPVGAGVFRIDVTATDARRIGGDLWATLTVDNRPVANWDGVPAQIRTGEVVDLLVQVIGGTSPFSFEYSGLPAGCSPGNRSNFSCSWASSGVYHLSANVSDIAGEYSLAALTLRVNATPPSRGLFWGGSGGIDALGWVAIAGGLVGLGVIAGVWRQVRRRRPPPP